MYVIETGNKVSSAGLREGSMSIYVQCTARVALYELMSRLQPTGWM